MTDTPELKPCPFCGGPVSVGWFAITCNINCDSCQYSIDTEAPEAVRESGADFTDALQAETKRAAITAWNTRAAPQIKPLVWLPSSDRRIELGRMHGYDEWLSYLGDERHLHWYRVYPVSNGKWRWVEMFRMIYIGGNTKDLREPNSADEAKSAAQAHHNAAILSALE